MKNTTNKKIISAILATSLVLGSCGIQAMHEENGPNIPNTPQKTNARQWKDFILYRGLKKATQKTYQLCKATKDKVTGLFVKTPPEQIQEIIPPKPKTNLQKIQALFANVLDNYKKAFLKIKDNMTKVFNYSKANVAKTLQHLKQHKKKTFFIAAIGVVAGFFAYNARKKRLARERRARERRRERERRARERRARERRREREHNERILRETGEALRRQERQRRRPQNRRQNQKKRRTQEKPKLNVAQSKEREIIEIPKPTEIPVQNPADAQKCLVCYEDTHKHNMHKLSCDHDFCKGCLCGVIQRAINENSGHGSSHNLRCPLAGSGCTGKIEEKDIRTLTNANSKVLARVQEFKTREWYDSQPKDHIKQCPTPNCEFRLFNPENVKQERTCDQCKNKFCTSCCLRHSMRISCQQAKINEAANNNMSEEERRLTKEWLEKNTTQCPFCERDVQKRDGCNHMTCKCKKEFCYRCGTGYENRRKMCRC